MPIPKKQDFLVEIGTEELPPKSLLSLSQAFAEGIAKELDAAEIQHGAVEPFATPRRLAVRVRAVAPNQPEQNIRRLGPAVAASFDASGAPTKAALGFAASCGVPVESLDQVEGPKGKVLAYSSVRPGVATRELLPAIVSSALGSLPIAKRMRWGAGTAEFVRPVHWVVLLLGDAPIETEILGVRTGRHTRGHRFHSPGPLAINRPSNYERILEGKGKVLADFGVRRERIRTAAEACAANLAASVTIESGLLDEVTSLVEWPVPITGRFEDRFLSLPAEVPVAVMQDHQRYFPMRDAGGALISTFVAVANIESKDPEKIRQGNERVIRPRLADAAFFWDTDRKQPLHARRNSLRTVTFQQGLGSLYDKSERVRIAAVRIAERIGGNPAVAARAAELCKCDLLSLMVGEFPELQGTMGKYYAGHDGETAEVATAIEEHYRPRYAGDNLPQTRAGMAVAIADRMDTIAGIFALGQKPTGTRDPFGLRRAALGVLRICIEQRLDLDLNHIVDWLADSLPGTGPEWRASIYDYIMERLRAYYLEDTANGQTVTTEMFDAVLTNKPGSPLDFDARILALAAFLQLPDAQSLAAANKRIANILRKSDVTATHTVDSQLLTDPAERALFDQVVALERLTLPMLAKREYGDALTKLATLRPSVDRFFDAVMVMAEDPAVRNNRLALLARLRKLFLHTADLSRLPG